jgi:outer membrane receptor protein involved in Fe transport
MPFSTGALAQSDDEQEDVYFEEILVTATRREEAIMDVNQSIQAITSAQLELPTFNEMSDVFNLVPGATVYSNKAPNKEGLQLRGSGIIQSGSADDMSPVGYYVDDIPYVDISTPTPPPIGTFDIERVEVLRGPQGTSWGQDSSAGSVIMRTKAVDLENFGYMFRAGVSDTESYSGTGSSVGAVFNIPLAEDVFGVRVSYLREEDPGYGSVVGQPDFRNPLESTRDSIRVKAYWNASEKVDIEMTHSEWNTEWNVLPGLQIADTTGGGMLIAPTETNMLLTLFPDGRPKNEYEIEWTTLLARFDLGAAELTYSAGYVDTPKKETNSELVFFGFLSGIVFNQPAETTTQELRLVSTTDSKLQWIAGLFTMDAENNSSGFTETPDFFFYTFETSPVDADAFAAYGEIDYAINDRWSFEAGLRYNDEERVNRFQESFGLTFVDPVFGPYTFFNSEETVDKTEFDAMSYRFGVNWSPSENGLVYLTHSRANRPPIILGQSQKQALEDAGLPQIGDTEAAVLLNTEIGTKWTLADGRAQVEAAYIFSDWQDVPLWSTVNTPPVPTSMAIGGTDAEVRVFELSLAWALTSNLTVNYAGSWTDAEVTKVPDPADVSFYPPAVEKGGDLPNYSPQTNNFGLNYSRSVGSDWEIFGSLNYVNRDKPAGLDVFINPFEYIPARDEYENMGINLGASKGPWTFTFSIANATDDDGQYLPRTDTDGDDARLFGLIQPPRTYSFQIDFDGMK